MTKPRMIDVKLRFTAAELVDLEGRKPSWRKRATWLKDLLMSAPRDLLGPLVPNSPTSSLEVPCPDPARARVQIRTTTTSPEEDSRSADPDAFAALLRDLPWYGAKFNGGSTPQSLAKTLVETYPKVDHCQAAREASAWLMANPSRRKTQLPRFLTGWFSRAGDPKPWAGQGKLNLSTEAGKEHARETESWSWEDYDKSNESD